MDKLKFSNLNKKLIYLFLACAVVFTAFQSFLILKFYEADIFLYAHGTALPTLFGVALALFVAVVLAYCSLCRCEEYDDKLAKTSALSFVFGILTAACVIMAGVMEYTAYKLRASDLMYIAQKEDKFIVFSSILAFVAFIYFLVPAKLNKLKALLGSVTVVWHILYLLSVYFDMTSPLNDPMRLMNEFALVGIMMYLTVEIRYLCGIPKKGFYVGVSVVAITLLLGSSVSNLLFAFGGNTVQGGNMGIYVYQLFAAGYILTRLFAQLNNKKVD